MLRRPFQGILGDNTGRPPLTHALQCGGGHSCQALDGDCGGGVFGTREIRKGGSEDGILFYEDDNHILLMWPEQLQWAFGFLVSLFDWVGLKTNEKNMVGIVC